MADSVDPVADIVLWKGVAGPDSLRLRSISGQPDTVDTLFGEPSDAAGDRPHPLMSAAANETTDARTRWQNWFDALAESEASPPPLTLRYPWPDAAGASSPNPAARPWVLESIWVEQVVADQVAASAVPLRGHLLIPRPANIDLADKQTIRGGLHKVNNDLSIVSMVLEVIALRVRQPLDDAGRRQLTESADHALEAVRRSGQIISAIQHQLKR